MAGRRIESYLLGEGDGDFEGDGEGDGVGHVGDGEGEAFGDVDGEGDFLGEGVGDFFGEGDGEWLGVGEVQTILGLLAVLPPGMVSGPGPWPAKNSASGTTTMPTTTVNTNVTAPHSRRTKAQFTKREV